MRINVIDLDRQVVLTKDNISVSIDAAVYFKIINARYAIYRVEDVKFAVTQLTYAILKNMAGQFILQDILEKRTEIADDIEKQIDLYASEWGVKVENIYMKDIRLS